MIVGSDLPPEIKEIVDEAGVDNSFWWSNRHRQGKKPSIGDNTSKIPNLVPNSSIELTQSDSTLQPTSDNDGFYLNGDTVQDTNGSFTSSLGKGVLVWSGTQIASDANQFVLGFDSTSSGGELVIRARSDFNGMQIWVDNDSGTNATADVSGNPTSNQVVIATSINWPDIFLAARDSNGNIGTDTYSHSGTLSDPILTIGNMGTSFEGNIDECLMVIGLDISNQRVKNLRDRAFQRNR